jgi:hypothetical protein
VSCLRSRLAFRDPLTVEALAAFSDFALNRRVRLGVPEQYADRQ